MNAQLVVSGAEEDGAEALEEERQGLTQDGEGVGGVPGDDDGVVPKVRARNASDPISGG